MDHLNWRIGWPLFRKRVGHQKDGHTADLAQCLPALLAVLDPVLHGQVQRVEKYTGGNLEAEAVMLALVAEVLGLLLCEKWFCHEIM